jgi:Matrixin
MASAYGLDENAVTESNKEIPMPIESLRQMFARPNRPSRRRTRRQLSTAIIAALEDRCLLSSFDGLTGVAVGAPWHQPARLTLSFAPDGTSVAGDGSSLYAKMGSVASTASWQRAIVSAFQTWAVSSNINIGLTADGGQALGTSGLVQGDSRFGDIRIAAVPLSSDVLAMSVNRSSAISGTWAGDVIFNSAANFASLDQVFAIALHEAGHVLGLPHSDDPHSPMFAHDDPTVSRVPATADLSALQNLYGLRRLDLNDLEKKNDTVKRATEIESPSLTYDGKTPLIAYGDLSSVSDVDFFEVDRLAGYTGTITVELRSAEISQLTGRLSLVNEKGKVLGTAKMSGGLGGKVSVTIDSARLSGDLFIRVDKAAAGISAIGSYALVVKFDSRLTVGEAEIAPIARGYNVALEQSAIERLFAAAPTSQPPASMPVGENAIELRTAAGYQEFSHYDTQGIIANGGSVAYVVKSPKSAGNKVMTVALRSAGWGNTPPRVTVYDSDDKIVPAHVLSSGFGSVTMQIKGIKPGREYRIRVEAMGTGGQETSAAFDLEADFSQKAVEFSQFAADTLDADQTVKLYQLDVSRSVHYQFGLAQLPPAVESVDAQNTLVQMTIVDAQGRVVYRLAAGKDGIRTAESVLLQKGSYFVRIEQTVIGNFLPGSIAYTVLGAVLSDPVGPIPGDATATPPDGQSPTGPVNTTVTLAPVAPTPAPAPSPAPAPIDPLLYYWYWYLYGGVRI